MRERLYFHKNNEDFRISKIDYEKGKISFGKTGATKERGYNFKAMKPDHLNSNFFVKDLEHLFFYGAIKGSCGALLGQVDITNSKNGKRKF